MAIIFASLIVLPLLFNVIYGTGMGRRSIASIGIASIGLSMIGYPKDYVMDGLIAILEYKELLFFSTVQFTAPLLFILFGFWLGFAFWVSV